MAWLCYKINKLRYFLSIRWLFTYSDIKTIILPSLGFALLNSHSAACFGFQMYQPNSIYQACKHIVFVIIWIWANLLPFAIGNQRTDESIVEDQCNKPWRPLPSGMLTKNQARNMVLFIYPLTISISVVLGATLQCFFLLGLGVWYNELRGADKNWLLRNFINACGFICYMSGSLQIMLRVSTLYNRAFVEWLLVIGGVVFSTVQIQDMSDQAGDKLRNRKTAPLVIGDTTARFTIVVSVIFWCWFCPWFWSMSSFGFLVDALLGSTLVLRTLALRTQSADHLTFYVWNV